MTDFQIRPATADDIAVIQPMNEAAVPHVNSLSAEELEALRQLTIYCRVVEREGAIIGFLFGFAPGSTYQSIYYRWFDANHDDFVYIDRVVVDPAVHASGIGKALYADIEAFARERASKIACEVNTVPPNERSQRFHHSLGFRQVGIKSTNEGAKQVSLLIKPLD